MFRKAERKRAKLRLGICGPAGSGKTYSSLLIAKGIGGKIAMLDTEHSSGELYSDLLDYDIEILNPPFSPERYIRVIKEAGKDGYRTLIIDSLSHAWAGVEALLQSPLHIISTMRAKTSYSILNENGKAKPVKIGLNLNLPEPKRMKRNKNRAARNCRFKPLKFLG